jgi:hypothetical protein
LAITSMYMPSKGAMLRIPRQHRPGKYGPSVYTPVTNAGVAAILTGRPPSENGVHTRKEMDLLTLPYLEYANQRGKTSVMVEGNIKILNLEVEPVLILTRIQKRQHR